MLEKLPPVLILHLKYFIYDSKGGLQKLSKKVDYPVDLEINKDILSTSIRTKVHNRYKLFAGECLLMVKHINNIMFSPPSLSIYRSTGTVEWLSVIFCF